MASSGHRSARSLYHHKLLSHVEVKGYGLACIGFAVSTDRKHGASYTRIARRTNLSQNVFLCTDGLLRLFTTTRIPRNPYRGRLWARGAPRVLGPLPTQGDSLRPYPGHWEILRRNGQGWGKDGGKIVERNAKGGKTSRPSYGDISVPVWDDVFHGASLEGALVAAARAG